MASKKENPDQAGLPPIAFYPPTREDDPLVKKTIADIRDEIDKEAQDIGPKALNGAKFEYSPENPPPLEVLESKIFAVHTTPILPANGALIASARNLSPETKFKGEEPPSFRPTLHFSLGAVAQPHKGRGQHSLENNPYAVIASLKTLEPQLINLSAQDTFIAGNFNLQKGITLLVPKGTNTSSLPNDIEIREYDPSIGIRKAVDYLIREKDGWHIKMQPGAMETGAVAHIDEVEMNSSPFFDALFEKYPHLSFGIHSASERGEGFRFGVIDGALNSLMKSYFGNIGSIRCTRELSFLKAVIIHNLKKLEEALKNFPKSPEVQQAFQDKKAKLRGWLNIADCDIDIRQKIGKTFINTPQAIKERLLEIRNDPEGLKRFADEKQEELPTALEHDRLNEKTLGKNLAMIAPQELSEFMAENKSIFTQTNLPIFYTHYAANRWIYVKTKKAEAEELDQIFTNSLAQLSSAPETKDEEIFEILQKFLAKDSNRLDTALEILRNSDFKDHLAKTIDLHFGQEGPKTLKDVLMAHPKTKILFGSQGCEFSNEEAEAFQLLEKLDLVEEIPVPDDNKITNFSEALRLAREIEDQRMDHKEAIQSIMTSMSTAKTRAEMLLGDKLSTYETLRLRDDTNYIWRQLGLEEEYRRKFPTDDLFWSSEQSLLEIYEMLKKQKYKKTRTKN